MKDLKREIINRNLIFVYGTLREGGELWKRVLDGSPHATLEGRGKTEGRLYDLGWFPGAVPAKGREIVGDLFWVSDSMLRNLDGMENTDPRDPTSRSGLYRREAILAVCDDGTLAEAWIYWINWMPERIEARKCPEIESGDWLSYTREREARRA